MIVPTSINSASQKLKSLLNIASVGMKIGDGLGSKLALTLFLMHSRLAAKLKGPQAEEIRKFRIKANGIAMKLCISNSFSDAFVLCEVFKGNDYLKNPIAKPKVIFDLGANIGLTAMRFHAAYPEASIYCFEPDPENFAKLALNAAGIPQIKAFDCGLSDKAETLTFYKSKDFHMRNSTTSRNPSDIKTSIRCVSFEEAMTMAGVEFIDFLKFDIEGAELKALGTTSCLRNVGSFAGELHPYLWKNGDEEQIIAHLAETHELTVERERSKVFVFGKLKAVAATKIAETAQGKFAIDSIRDKKILQQLSNLDHEPLLSLGTLSPFVDKKSVVLDIGAHIGTFSVPVAQRAAKVIAFEPSPKTYELLAQNISINNLHNMEARRKGLSSAAGLADLGSRPAENAGGQILRLGEGAIEISTLDKEISGEVHAIKIDVEGMELDVFKGGQKLLEKHHPVIFLEVNIKPMKEHGNSVAELSNFLASAGYRQHYPFFKGGKIMAGKVASLSIVSALVTPRSFLLNGPSMPFDILAISKDRSLPEGIKEVTGAALLRHLFLLNIKNKLQRLFR